MKEVAVYCDISPFPPRVADAAESARKESGAGITCRSVRFFNPAQKEAFESAVVDGNASNAGAIAEALKTWGVKAVITEPLEAEAERPSAPDNGGQGEVHPARALADMSLKELEAEAELLGFKFPSAVNTKAERVAYIEERLTAPDGGGNS